MRIVIASTGKELSSQMSFPFGRCRFFLVVEAEGEEIKIVGVIENTAQAQRGGAGITASQIVAEQKPDAVIAGAFGPRAFGVLGGMGVKMFTGVEGTVEENVRKLLAGELEEVTESEMDSEGKGN